MSLELGAEPVTPLLAGSGPSMFAILDPDVAERASRQLGVTAGFTCVARPLDLASATAIQKEVNVEAVAALFSGFVAGAAVGVFGLGIFGPLLVAVPTTNWLRRQFPDPSNWVMVSLGAALVAQAGCALLGLLLGVVLLNVADGGSPGLGSPLLAVHTRHHPGAGSAGRRRHRLARVALAQDCPGRPDRPQAATDGCCPTWPPPDPKPPMTRSSPDRCV